MENNLSTRGNTLADQKPVFLDVLQDIWDPVENPNGIVNIGLAENTLMHPEMKDFLNSQSQLHVDSHSLTYGDGFSGSQRLKESLCHFLNNQFAPVTQLHPSQMAITSGVSNAIEAAAWALFDPGDHVMVGRPYFNAFRTIFGSRAGVELLEVKFGAVDPFSFDAIDQYEVALFLARKRGIRVKALVLCSPHNPLGRCYPEDIIKEYMRFCGKHNLHLISDEIYALSVWNNPELPEAALFKSVLSVPPKGLIDPSMLHVAWGLSKDFGATGLRIGCLISQSNKHILDAADGISLFNFPSSLADKLTSSILFDNEFTSKYIVTNQQRLLESYCFATKFLNDHGILYHKSNAAFFLWINLGAATKNSKISDDEILGRLRAKKVYIAAGSAYMSEETGWFRMVFAHPTNVLEKGFRRMVEALDI